MSTICVALVVRNAAEYVGVCLRSVLAQQCNIGYWIAVDLGSDDDTLLTITNIFEPNGIHGHIVCEPGRTAEEILSAALEAARPHADYTWVIDPTNVIVGYMTLPEKLTADVYSLQYVSDNQKTQSLAIFSNAIDWHYVGTPEYPVCSKEQYENVSVEGYYHINYTSKEAKRAFKKRECYERAAELEKQIGQVGERMPDYEHHQLVLSDAWFACERYDLARSNYAKRSKLGGDRQEVYYSLVRISECYRLEKNTQAALEASLDAHAQFPRRAEPLYQAGLFYMELEQHDKAFTLLKKALQLPYPVGQQFVAEDVYRYALAQVFAMCSYTVGEHQQCFDVACDLLNENRLPEVEREAMQKLRLMCVKHIKDSLLNYDAARVSRICNRSKRKRKLPILFSITTCRRLDLFVRTMNSFLNCCGDLDMIEEWLCVDDNSSEEDIAEMKRLFPFMTFVCKSEEDKGHARSLNLIRKYAIAGKYEYLLHLEDDWQFFEQRSYIEPAVHIFDSTRKKNGLSVYGQVLFNRNYAEVEKCIEIVGGQVRYSPERGLRFLEHEHLSPEEFKERFSEPCLHNAHWPHYSLRPSLIDCKALFLIGEYNEQAVHFEMEYAERYERLFKSCFFDSIVCLHTGKLTNEEGENTSSLNGQQQFAQ